MDISVLSISKIGLSVRSENALKRAGVFTVEDLCKCDEEKLNSIRNLGQKSIDEILCKIKEFMEEKNSNHTADDFEKWINSEDGKKVIDRYLRENKIKVDVLENLSVKAYNLLIINGYDYIYEVPFYSFDELMLIPLMEIKYANEIIMEVFDYLICHKEVILADIDKVDMVTISIYEIVHYPEYHDVFLEYVKNNDIKIIETNLSNRSKNQLMRNSLFYLSDIIFMEREDFYNLPSLGANSVNEIIELIYNYLDRNETGIRTLFSGDKSALFSDEKIKNSLISLFNSIGFNGLSFTEIKDKLKLPEYIEDDRLKKIIGTLLSEKQLEYVDYRCYRVYDNFEDVLNRCTILNERSKSLLLKRLQGKTLESIGQEYNITRERVRQIVKQEVKNVRNWYLNATGKQYFDEDYFSYFYSNYNFDKKSISEWIGLDESAYNYFEMMDIKQGKKDLYKALEDRENIEAGLRYKLYNYINRNKILIDEIWVEKKRADLEIAIVKKFCKDDKTFNEFVEIYNNFLGSEEIPFDEGIYQTDSIIRSGKNRLAESRYVLWKQNEKLRYYDIDGKNYEELYDELNLDSFENIEMSTLKLFNEHLEVMNKYDIRDHYELHNLLRKTVNDGDFNDFKIERTPNVKFGEFNRDDAIFLLMVDNAPISINDLAEIVSNEYGFDPAVVIGSYFKCISEYYHNGIFKIDQKVMSESKLKRLKEELTDDFYYIEEIRDLYKKVFPDGDIEEINPYNLKISGFSVLSRYVVRTGTTLNEYFVKMLTEEEKVDITEYRKRFVYVQAFSMQLTELKKNLDVIETEPNYLINFSLLERNGFTKSDLRAFCDEVYDFVETETYFTIHSIKKNGFNSELFDLGFSDWFYSSILLSDDRLSSGRVYKNMMFYKGDKKITTCSLLENIVTNAGSIDAFDLLSVLNDDFGCTCEDRYDFNFKLKSTKVYYDNILERYYSSADMYYMEIDEVDGV